MSTESPTLLKAELFSRGRKAIADAKVLSASIDATADAARAIGQRDYERRLEKIAELHRYLVAQMDALVNRLGGEGAP